MTSEFKKIKNNEDTHYVLETATSGATSAGAVATAPGKSRKDSILAQEKKETPKPRNFVAKNAKMGGAGKMKDKSKTLPRHEKHKKPVAEDFEDMPDELMDPAVWKKATLKQKYKAVVDAGLIEKPYQSSYIGWMNDEINRITGKPYDDSGIPRELKNGELDLNKVYRSALAKYQDRKHSSDLTSQDREHELTIGTAGRAEMIRKVDELAEMKRVTLRNERLQDEEVAFQRAETIQQRKDEMKKIADKYQHDLTVIDKEHRNNMESIRTGNNHEINKIDKEHAEARREREHSSSESDKDRAEREREREQNRPKPEKPKPVEMPEPEEEPRPRPSPGAGNKFDQDTGEPIRPQSNQWHTNQQVGYNPTKPSKKDDDVIDVEPKPPKPNKPLALKEKITVVKDPAKATGIQQTGGITHGSVYAGKPITQPYRITPGATYTPGKPLPQSLQQKLDGKTNTGRAVDAKGRTQQQWLKLVKAKFPDAKIMQAKMMDGPVHAMLPDGRKLSWNKVEQGVAEGVAETMPMRDAQQVLNHYGADYFKTTHDTLYFSKYRKQFSIDRIRDNDSASAGSVNLSDLNAIVRKLRDMRVPLSPFGESFNGEYDDEAGMAHTNLLTSARAVMGLLKTIEDKDNLPEWVQEKIAKAEMMLVGVWDYLQSQKEQGIDPQVEGLGRMRGSSSAYDRDYASSVSGMGRGPDHRGLGQELAHETNNYAVAIDGKTWKVFADQRQAENIARSLKAKGKNATVHPTGENPSESADPYFESLRAKVEELAKK